MRVLHLCGEYPPRRLGGVATFVENVARVQRASHEVGVVVLEGREYRREPSGAPAAQVVDLDLARICEHSLVGTEALRASMPLEGLLGEQWDVIHAHDWYGAWPALALRPQTRATVMTAHLPLRFGFSYANHALPFREKSRLEALGFRLSKRVLAPSRYVAAILEREYDVPPALVRVVPNGVDAISFSHGGTRASVPTVLSVSRLNEQKGLDHLLVAFAKVRETMPDAVLEIAGEGPMREALEEIAGEGVRFLGHVPHRELPEVYARAHVFASCSLHEPFGLTTLEAMACGTPVVVSPLGGTAEFVEEGVTGHVRAPHDPLAFAGALQAILEDPALGERMGRAAAERASSMSWERTAERIDAAYAEALA